MQKDYNLSNLEASFRSFLIAVNQSKVSISNYISDLRYYHAWYFAHNTNDSIENINFVTFLSISNITSYKNYLVENNIPDKSINRRLSTLRKLCSFCISQQVLAHNNAKKVSNINTFQKENSGNSDPLSSASIPTSYRAHLQSLHLSKHELNKEMEDVNELITFCQDDGKPQNVSIIN